MQLKRNLAQLKNRLIGNSVDHLHRAYFARFQRNAFAEGACKNEAQFEAYITKMYHSVEKGLSYADYRPGFGRKNIDSLISAMEKYAGSYDVSTFCYETALCTLNAYVAKNREAGYIDEELEKRIQKLPGCANTMGGTTEFSPMTKEEVQKLNYADFVKSRHSIRHFDSESVPGESIERAIALARHTPSACNRQGWKARWIEDKNQITELLKWQNGNRGFGEEIDKLIIITGDLRYFSKSRELYQVFIDGGMYAMRVLDALHYEGIGTIPMSAALTAEQEKSVRKILGVDDAEVFILFIGVGYYPQLCITTRSERRPI